MTRMMLPWCFLLTLPPSSSPCSQLVQTPSFWYIVTTCLPQRNLLSLLYHCLRASCYVGYGTSTWGLNYACAHVRWVKLTSASSYYPQGLFNLSVEPSAEPHSKQRLPWRALLDKGDHFPRCFGESYSESTKSLKLNLHVICMVSNYICEFFFHNLFLGSRVRPQASVVHKCRLRVLVSGWRGDLELKDDQSVISQRHCNHQ